MTESVSCGVHVLPADAYHRRVSIIQYSKARSNRPRHNALNLSEPIHSNGL
jgi:hypothetical protein